jgi:hypothetical protein
MSLEYYKKQMVDLRAKLQREKDAKKKDNEYYARMVKFSSTPSGKASYRKMKIDRAASHDRQIESIKRQIENCKDNIAREHKHK